MDDFWVLDEGPGARWEPIEIHCDIGTEGVIGYGVRMGSRGHTLLQS